MRGFTLIELLIAILVFSILGFTVTSRVSGIATQSFQMERRAVAHWVAQNQLQRLQLSRVNNNEPLVTGNETERVYMGNRDWLVRYETVATDHPWMHRVEIEVFELAANGEEIGPLHSGISFLGRY